jgi:Domain of unknown function (DUF4234)
MSEPPAWQSPQPAGGFAPAPAYGYPPPPGYGYAPQPYGYPPQGWPGQIRRTGICVLLTVCTLGIYIFVYNYKVHFEMKRYSGRGVGGGIALLLTFIANVAMPFVTPAEVGSLYSLRGERPPVSGWTGLWYLVPVIGGYIVYIIAVVALTLGSGPVHDDAGVVALLLIYLCCSIGGALTWFIKTNGALNRYWSSVGVQVAG